MPTDRKFAAENEEIPAPKFEKLTMGAIPLILLSPTIVQISAGIGTGEQISGPINVVAYGPFILWLATISITLQMITGRFSSRYTIATGETLQAGINRLWIGRTAWTLIRLGSTAVSWWFPLFAAQAGATYAFAYLGMKVPGANDKTLVFVMSMLCIAIGVVCTLLSKRISRTLARISVFNVAWLVIFYIALGLYIVPPANLITVFTGFFSFGSIPKGASFTLLAAIAGYAGTSANGAEGFSSYWRDADYGMSAKAGYISGLRGKQPAYIARGYMPKLDEEGMKRFNGWYMQTSLEMGFFWLCSMVTMWFPCAIAWTYVPTGVAVPTGFAFTVALANYLIPVLPIAPLLLTISQIIGWTMSNISTVDGSPRGLSNTIWYGFPSFAEKMKGNIRPVYLICLFGQLIAWAIGSWFGTPVWIAVFQAGFANVLALITYVGMIGVNYVIMPKPLRFKWYELLACIVGFFFYLFFAVNWAAGQFGIVFKF